MIPRCPLVARTPLQTPLNTNIMAASTNQNSVNGVTDGSTESALFEVQGEHPVHYGVLLFPGFQALDAFGPLDIINLLSMLYPFPIKLSMLANISGVVETSHRRAGKPMLSHPKTDCSQSIHVDRTFEEQLKIQELGVRGENGKETLDVLIVPGGMGTRNDMTAEIDFIRRMYPSLKAVLTVCTGSTICARAGILDGRRATTNKRNWEWATSTGSHVKWIGEARWVVDGNITTASGVAAGMDATYAFISANYGEEIAQELANNAEYVRWTDADYDPFAKRWNVCGT